jgi:hypothetical protein
VLSLGEWRLHLLKYYQIRSGEAGNYNAAQLSQLFEPACTADYTEAVSLQGSA